MWRLGSAQLVCKFVLPSRNECLLYKSYMTGAVDHLRDHGRYYDFCRCQLYFFELNNVSHDMAVYSSTHSVHSLRYKANFFNFQLCYMSSKSLPLSIYRGGTLTVEIIGLWNHGMKSNQRSKHGEGFVAWYEGLFNNHLKRWLWMCYTCRFLKKCSWWVSFGPQLLANQ